MFGWKESYAAYVVAIRVLVCILCENIKKMQIVRVRVLCYVFRAPSKVIRVATNNLSVIIYLRSFTCIAQRFRTERMRERERIKTSNISSSSCSYKALLCIFLWERESDGLSKKDSSPSPEANANKRCICSTHYKRTSEPTRFAYCVGKSAVWKKCHFFFPAENLVAVCKPRAVCILRKYTHVVCKPRKM